MTVIAPTPVPTQLGPITPTSPFETPTPDVEQDGEPALPSENQAELGFFELTLGLVGVVVIASGGYWTGRMEGWRSSKVVRSVWILTLGALLGYNYIALGLQGSNWLMGFAGVLTGFTAAVIGGVLAWLILQIWTRIQ